MDYFKIYKETINKGSLCFNYKGEKFKTFLDDDGDFCVTHYSTKYLNNENAFLAWSPRGLEKQIEDWIK